MRDSFSVREASLKEGPALEPLVLGGAISLFTGDVQRLVEDRSSLCFPGSGDALALRDLLLSTLWYSGAGLELWTPSSLRWPWCRLGAQARSPEEGPSSSRMHENAAGNHGLQGALGVEGRI